MKYWLFILLSASLSYITSYGQLQECERMYRAAIIFAGNGQYELALHKLAAAKICNPQSKKYDSLVIAIYTDINRQKEIAIQARQTAETALKREKEAKDLETIARKEAVEQKENVQKQLVTNYWNNSHTSREDNDWLTSVHYMAEAAVITNDKNRIKTFWIDINDYLPQTRLNHILFHKKALFRATFSPDGKKVLTASTDSTARLWNAVSGEQIGPAMKIEGNLSGCMFSPDGKKVLTVNDSTLSLWDAATGKQISRNSRSYYNFTTAIFNPDGKQILTVNYASTAHLWDVETSAQVGRLMKNVDSAVFGPDGKRILTRSSDSTVCIWNAGTSYAALSASLHTALADTAFREWNARAEQQIGKELKHEGPVDCFLFSPGGEKILTVSSGRFIRFWDPSTGNQLGPGMEMAFTILNVVFSPDAKYLLLACSDLTARLLEASTGQQVGPPMKHKGDVRDLAFSPDGKLILTVATDKTVRLWDAATGRPFGMILQHNSEVVSAAFRFDGKQVLTASTDGTARLWEVAEARPRRPSWQQDYAGFNAVFSPDGKQIVTASAGNKAYVWNVATGTLSGAAIEDESSWTTARFTTAVFSPDAKKIVTASNDRTVRLWNATTRKQVGATLKHNDAVYSAVFSPDGKKVLSTCRDGTVRLWDPATGKQQGPALKHESDVFDAVFSPDGKKILTSCRNGTTRMWNLSTKKQTGPSLTHTGEVIMAAFSPDGKQIITASSDWTARVWDAFTGTPVGPALKHEGPVFHAVFSGDEKLILTASKDGTARLWDVVTKRSIGFPMNHQAPVTSAIFSPDQKQILTAGWDGTVRLWEVEGDLDLSSDLFKLQVLATTGTELNTAVGEVQLIPADRWYKVKEEYQKRSRDHYKICKYPAFNLWRLFFPDEAEKLQPVKKKLQLDEPAEATAQHSLGLLYKNSDAFKPAEQSLKKSLAIRGRLAENKPQTYQAAVAETQNELGFLYLNAKRYREAEKYLLESAAIRKKWVHDKEAYWRACTDAANKLMDQLQELFYSLKYDAFKQADEISFDFLEQFLRDPVSSNPDLKNKLCFYYFNCSWYLLFARRFEEAEKAAERVLTLCPTDTMVKTNLAHALLFQGKTEEALTIYNELKVLRQADSCLEDMDELEKNGITRKEVEKVRALLSEDR